MVSFKAGDTWKTIFLIRDTGGSKEKKSDPSVALLKQLFLKNNNSADTNPIRSDPESDPIRSEIWSHPQSDPESDAGFVNGRFLGTFALKCENLANLPGLKVKNGFNLDTNVGAQNLHLLLTEFADFWSLKGSGTMMVELSSLVFLAASMLSILRKIRYL